jgi:parvulin-like peptidyl-prolyl isomerase
MTRVAILLLLLPLTAPALAAQRPVPSHAATTAVPAGTAQEVARVNGVAVTSDRLAAALAALIPQESFHQNVSADKMASLRQQALATVIDEELAYQDAVRRGMRPSSADLKSAWTQTVARYGGAATFDAALRQAGVSRESIEREINRRLLIEKNYSRSVMDHCSVSPEEAESFFTQNPDRFVEPEQVHVHAITIGVDPSSGAAQWRQAKSRAQEARAALDRGMTFAEAAKTYSTDPSREHGGDMGFMHRGSMAGPFEAIVQKLPVGTPSDVVESLYGYHVVMVSEVHPAQRKTFDQVSSSLVKDLSATRCTERRDQWLGGLRAAARIQKSEPTR